MSTSTRDLDGKLLVAVTTGRPERVRFLLGEGANPNARDRASQTALHVAACAGRVDCIEALLRGGASVHEHTISGASALHYTAICQRPAGALAAQRLLDAAAALEHRDITGQTPLHWAARARNAGAIRFLLSAGAALEAQTGYGDRPLHLALRAVAGVGTEAVAALLAAGADINARNRFGQGPVDVAGTRDLAELMRAFRAARGARAQLVHAGGSVP